MLEIAVNFIKKWEGFRAIPYLDRVGIPTIGYGTIVYPDGKKVDLLDPAISKERAEELLSLDLEKRSKGLLNFLNKCDSISLSDNQVAALLSFCYNLGNGPVVTPGRSMNKALLSGDNESIANSFLLYNKATENGLKIEVQGLTNRRKAERELFLS